MRNWKYIYLRAFRVLDFLVEDVNFSVTVESTTFQFRISTSSRGPQDAHARCRSPRCADKDAHEVKQEATNPQHLFSTHFIFTLPSIHFILLGSNNECICFHINCRWATHRRYRGLHCSGIEIHLLHWAPCHTHYDLFFAKFSLAPIQRRYDNPTPSCSLLSVPI